MRKRLPKITKEENEMSKQMSLKPTGKSIPVDCKVGKPAWFVEPIKKEKIYHGCLNCGGTEQILDLETRLYFGFGGWTITKDGELYFMDDRKDVEWEDWRQLKEIEAEASKDPDHDWRAQFDSPLRGGQYQRHGEGKWVLIESNQGFA